MFQKKFLLDNDKLIELDNPWNYYKIGNPKENLQILTFKFHLVYRQLDKHEGLHVK